MWNLLLCLHSHHILHTHGQMAQGLHFNSIKAAAQQRFLPALQPESLLESGIVDFSGSHPQAEFLGDALAVPGLPVPPSVCAAGEGPKTTAWFAETPPRSKINPLWPFRGPAAFDSLLQAHPRWPNLRGVGGSSWIFLCPFLFLDWWVWVRKALWLCDERV